MMDKILQRIEKVIVSDWTGDMYLSPSDVLGKKHTGTPGIVFCGDLATDELYEAILAMIDQWDCETLHDISCSEYKKPAT
jgi:hypothetical protein